MRSKNFIPYLLMALLVLSGCTALSNMDELSVLGDYSREKDNQHRLVKSINDHYDQLTKVIADGSISRYKNKSSFILSFGEPIVEKDMGDGTQRWIYRYAIYRFAKDEVNVYFDRNGDLVKWEKLPCPSFF